MVQTQAESTVRRADQLDATKLSLQDKDWVVVYVLFRLCACRYAWECQTQDGGWGLDQTLRDNNWKFRGIVNGMDYSEWSPQQDVHLQSDGYQNYGQDNLRDGKARCKEALQKVSSPVNSMQ